MIRVLVSGAAGRMGKEVVKTIWGAEDTELVGAVDPMAVGVDVGSLLGIAETGIKVRGDLAAALAELKPEVLVDFTTPKTVFANASLALKNQVRPIIGTTGLSPEQIAELQQLAKENQIGGLVAPNFAVGAVLMMKLASITAKYLPHVEIIELHHDKKLDSPSGTAIKTAELIEASRQQAVVGNVAATEKIPGCRGGNKNGIHIHSVRLPGLVAHQELIFGGVGETLTIRHDSISRESFMPGVLLAVRKASELQELIYGLDNIIFSD